LSGKETDVKSKFPSIYNSLSELFQFLHWIRRKLKPKQRARNWVSKSWEIHIYLEGTGASAIPFCSFGLFDLLWNWKAKT